MSQLMTSTLNKLRSLPLLSISAIDGNAVGGGAEVCTAADWRVMGAKARVQFVQTRMGASTGWGGAARLSEIVGNRSTALSLLLHQPSIDANAAVACRLADAVAAEGEPAAAEAERLLLKAFECAATPNAIKAIKTAVAAATPIGRRLSMPRPRRLRRRGARRRIERRSQRRPRRYSRKSESIQIENTRPLSLRAQPHPTLSIQAHTTFNRDSAR